MIGPAELRARNGADLGLREYADHRMVHPDRPIHSAEENR